MSEASEADIGPGGMSLKRLNLTDFRCYDFVRLEVDSRPVVLTGPNGAGKTNVLEAVSFLAPGRGLRAARLGDVGRRNGAQHRVSESFCPRAWAVAAQLAWDDATVDIGTGLEPATEETVRERRIIKIDGETGKSQTDLGRLTSALWLTPQMDRLFLEGASGRRRFIDRLILGLHPDHSGPVSAYDHSMRSRNKLLKDGSRDAEWLDSVEDSMARHGVAVVVRRLETVRSLCEIAVGDDGPFPGADLDMHGRLESWLNNMSALDAEDRFREVLAIQRDSDRDAGATSTGPHRSDLRVNHRHHGESACQCSTGEQKALLIRIILAAARLQTRERGRPPLLLLDEIAAHLDATRRAALFDVICGLGIQAWMTGTDDRMFQTLGTRAQFFNVSAARIEKVPGSQIASYNQV